MGCWYLTFHGGAVKPAWNNIHAYDANGAPLGKRLDKRGLPAGLDLRELRGFAFGPDGDLYVANSWREASRILRFGGDLDARGRHPFREVFVAFHPGNPGLAHPFDVSFGPDGALFIPSQDTNVVGRYFGPGRHDPGAPGLPMPPPPGLEMRPRARPLPGTFVPSHRSARDGLVAVRGTHVGRDGRLYVADRDANRVRSYHAASGEPLASFSHPELTKPIHIRDGGGDRLLVGSRDANAIFTIDPASGVVKRLVDPGAGGLRGPAGMAIGPDGHLYVCSRETRQILRYDAKTGKPDSKPFIDNLRDRPEFIGWVDR